MPRAGAADHPCLGALGAWAARHPLPPEAAAASQPWAVAYSGGADSTALLLAAQALWPGRVQALHVHHGLQAAGDDFERHARAACSRLDVPLTVLRVDARHAPGQSPEDAARQSRYRALAAAALDAGAACVLLGQHAQDQAETLLLALSRGAGLPGLAGMAESFERHGARFGRPLLAVDGQALRDWLDGQGIAYVVDPTNADQRYTRNRIRARLLPAFAESFSAYAQTLARSARHAAQAQTLLDEVAAQDLALVGDPPVIKALQRLSRARQANLLRHWLRLHWQAGPSEAQLEQALEQIAACTTRGHQIRLKLASGYLLRAGAGLSYQPPI
ncbi:tRNA lysidine(34) synthetase TilS [Malikia spinosa]|uniref:tRNA(Ile)-lysidine synthase n=1 Tax=Malikia spinosa TaxID=86180 RepID=A0A2S9KGX2_9BURK|nr:tRNA lysidine(34) synthetase TilS [Malikia spinosa]PRD69692.1 tRNA lysidine(34) synthetase TilS [Malikia spinosa]